MLITLMFLAGRDHHVSVPIGGSKMIKAIKNINISKRIKPPRLEFSTKLP
jgi:hypothetical protein